MGFKSKVTGSAQLVPMPPKFVTVSSLLLNSCLSTGGTADRLFLKQFCMQHKAQSQLCGVERRKN